MLGKQSHALHAAKRGWLRCKTAKISFSSALRDTAEHGEAAKALNRQAQGTRDCPNDFYQCDTNVERGIGDIPSSVSNSF